MAEAAAACATDVEEAPANNAWRQNRPRNRSRKNRLKFDPPYSGWVEYGLDRKIVRGKHPNDLSRIAPLHEMPLLVWEILYNNGKRTADILDLYPDMIDNRFPGIPPPIGAAVYMNDIHSATVLLQRGVNLNISYAFSTRYDGYHAVSTTPIIRAMITPDRMAMLQILLQHASTDAKLYSLDNTNVSVPGTRDRVITLAASLPANTQFKNSTVREILEAAKSPRNSSWIDQELVDLMGDKFPGFLRNRSLVVRDVTKYRFQREMDIASDVLETYIKKKYNATILYSDKFFVD